MRLPDASPRSEAKKTAFPAILASTLVPRGADYPRIAPKSPANHPPSPTTASPLPRQTPKFQKRKGFPDPS